MNDTQVGSTNGTPTSSWAAESTLPRAAQMALTTFAILALELALIRWIGSQIRLAAYFANLILFATFFGMGLGVGLGERHVALLRWCLPLLAALSLVLAFANDLGLTTIRFPDPTLSLWATDMEATVLQFVGAALLMAACFWMVALVFVPPGAAVGALFARMPALSAYGADIAGSLGGVIAMSLAAWLGASPPIWFALGVVPLLWLRRDLLNVASAAVVVGAAWLSVSGAVFSPYNRIDLGPLEIEGTGLKPTPRAEWTLRVNRDFHQHMLDLSSGTEPNETRDAVRRVYELPFRVGSSRSHEALIVGAGAGNDVAAALRSGFEQVTSVDIDGRILDLGLELHPERPYQDPRVRRVVNDARAFFEQNPEPRYDVVCYGLLDSHAMFSAMSSLRLDNYVYTVEGLRAGWSHVRDDGVLSVSFSLFAGDWMMQRMYRTIRDATGIEPIYVDHGYNFGGTYLVGRHLTLQQVRGFWKKSYASLSPYPEIRLPHDDWPFLYLRPFSTPWAYIVVLLLIGTSGLLAVRGVFGDILSRSRFDAQMFLLGTGFMLLETRMVTQLSLLFGSTWIVNTSVFGGILCMILLANAVAQWRPMLRPALAYAGLVPAIVLIWALPVTSFNALDLGARAALAGLVFALPVFFAGLIFSSALRQRADTPAALGSNLCGAVLGGMLEYLSMVLGMRAIALLALAIYMASLLAYQRRQAAANA
jgi:hypothetical protein